MSVWHLQVGGGALSVTAWRLRHKTNKRMLEEKKLSFLKELLSFTVNNKKVRGNEDKWVRFNLDGYVLFPPCSRTTSLGTSSALLFLFLATPLSTWGLLGHIFGREKGKVRWKDLEQKTDISHCIVQT